MALHEQRDEVPNAGALEASEVAFHSRAQARLGEIVARTVLEARHDRADLVIVAAHGI